MHMEIRACLSIEAKLVKTKNGDATVGMRVEETKGIEWCIERRPRRYVLSTLYSKADRMVHQQKKQF